MKNILIFLVTIGIITFLGSAIAFTVLERPDLMPQKQIDTMDPLWQTQNLTSFFLLRRIENLRDTAAYVQNREEGQKLIELFEAQESTEEAANAAEKEEKE